MFLLAMDHLQLIFVWAMEAGILSPISHRLATIHVSLYMDDAALFLNPCKSEMAATQSTLLAFGRISGLFTNFNKSLAYPICCDDQTIAEVLSKFEGILNSLPCKYLGLPLNLRKLKPTDFQIIIDKIAAKLAG